MINIQEGSIKGTLYLDQNLGSPARDINFHFWASTWISASLANEGQSLSFLKTFFHTKRL